MPKEIERVSPQSLEIVLIDRFKSTIRDIHLAVSSSNDVCKEDDDDDPNVSAITVQSDGNGVHYSNRESPTNRSEEFYAYEDSETGEVIACEFVEYERDPDNTIDLIRIVWGKIKVKEGMLIQSINPQVVQSALRRLSQIGENLKNPSDTGSINSGQVPLDLPLINPAVLH